MAAVGPKQGGAMTGLDVLDLKAFDDPGTEQLTRLGLALHDA